MGIFGKKKAASPPVDPLSILSGGITAAFGASAPGAIQASDQESLRAGLSGMTESSLLLTIHSGAAEPCAGIFIPSSLSGTGAPDKLAALEAAGTAWAARFPESAAPALSFASLVDKEKLDPILWPFLEMEVYQIALEGKQLWLCINAALRETLTVPVSGVSVSGATPSASKPPDTLSIGRQRDFRALDSFIPQSLILGKNHLAAEKEAFGIVPGASAIEKLALPEGQEMVWYLASFEIAGAAPAASPASPAVKISLLYAFQKQRQNNAAPGQDPDALTNALGAALLQENAKVFALLSRQKPVNPGIKKLASPPDLSRTASLLIIKARLTGPSIHIPMVVASPVGALSPLFQTWIEPPAIKRLSGNAASLLLFLNARILAASFIDGIASPGLRKKIPFLLVAELLNQLSPADYDLVLQNCLISKLGAKKLPALLYYNETVTNEAGEVRERILPLGPLDFKRLASHMNETFREEFMASCGQLHENPLDKCIANNLEEMKNIETTVSYKRIASSPRVSFLLRAFFHKIIRAQAEDELKKLKAAGYPFSALKQLTPLLAQKAMNKMDDRDTALVLLDSVEEKETLRKFISSVRLVRLEEELSFMRGRYDAEDLNPEELIKAKHLLVKACEDVTHIAEAEAESKKVKGPAGPAPAAKPVKTR